MAVTKVTKTGFFQNLFNSVIGVFVGILLILGMICLLFFNEVKPNDADAAKSAKELTASNASSLNNKAVWVKGELKGTSQSDSYLKGGDYIVIVRTVEMFAYVEIEKTEERDKIGGGTETITTYTIETRWVTDVPDSSGFHGSNKQSVNPAKPVANASATATDMTINGYNVDSSKISFMSAYSTLAPSADNIADAEFAKKSKVDGSFLYFKGEKSAGTPNTGAGNEIGDYRIVFNYIANNTQGIVLAKLSGNNLINLDYKSTGVFKITGNVYRFFNLTSMDDVINLLQNENRVLTWVLRIVGAVVMIIGFTMLFGPLHTIAGIIPIFKKLTGALIFLVSLVFGVILSLIVILLANLLNNIFTLIGIILLIVAIVVFVAVKAKKKKAEQN